MIGAVAILNKGQMNHRWFMSLAMIYAIAGIIGLNDYISFTSINFLLGLFAIASVTQPARELKARSLYSLLALTFLLVCLFIPGRTVLYFALSAAVLFLVEAFFGRLTLLPFVVIILSSPIFKYTSDVFSFPIRLTLTEWAAGILSLTGNQSMAIGNMIYHNGTEMSVDPECMGLNMMVTSMLAGVIMFATFARKYNRSLSTWRLTLHLVLIACLNVISNLLRIITLVHFSIQPGTAAHEIIGIIFFLVYVIVPGILIARWSTKNSRKATVVTYPKSKPSEGANMYRWLHIPMVLLVCIAVISVKQHDERVPQNVPLPVIKDYDITRISGEILKLENKSSLIYLKYIPGFYNTDHNPMICWKGSGYVFLRVRPEEIDGSTVFTSELDKNNKEKLFTAWWYENGDSRTIAQLSWRKDVLYGSRNYYLVNVTAADRTELEQEVRRLHSNVQLKKFFLKGR